MSGYLSGKWHTVLKNVRELKFFMWAFVELGFDFVLCNSSKILTSKKINRHWINTNISCVRVQSWIYHCFLQSSCDKVEHTGIH